MCIINALLTVELVVGMFVISITYFRKILDSTLFQARFSESMYRESPPITNKNCLFVIRNRAKINIFTIFSTITAPMQDVKIVMETSKIV